MAATGSNDGGRRRLRAELPDAEPGTHSRVRCPGRAHAHFLDYPVQRIQRDLGTLSRHTVLDADVSGEQVGRSRLGPEMPTPD